LKVRVELQRRVARDARQLVDGGSVARLRVERLDEQSEITEIVEQLLSTLAREK
jgi:hypothetical protein